MNRVYTFEGNFMPLVRGRVSQGKVFDEYAHTRMSFLNVIEAQHGCDRKFAGKLALKILLLLPFSDGMSKQKQIEKNNFYHTNRPTLSLFIRTLEDLLAGVLFNDGSIIVSVQAEKRMSVRPGVEFILSEIE